MKIFINRQVTRRYHKEIATLREFTMNKESYLATKTAFQIDEKNIFQKTGNLPSFITDLLKAYASFAVRIFHLNPTKTFHGSRG